MKKAEHLKIVGELEKKIQDLEKQVLELKNKNMKLQFDSRLHRFISEQRAHTINEMLSNSMNNINYMKDYDDKVKNYYKQSMKQLKLDDEKFNELRNYIKKNFSHLIKEMKPDSQLEQKIKDENLSQTFIGEHGEIYKPYHVVDIAILIMENQLKKLKEILGDNDLDINNFEE